MATQTAAPDMDYVARVEEKPFLFLQLPGELRNRIYELTATLGSQAQLRRRSSRNAGVSANYAALLAANRQIRSEFYDIWLHRTEHIIRSQDLQPYLKTFRCWTIDETPAPLEVKPGRLTVILPNDGTPSVSFPPIEILPLIKLKCRAPEFKIQFQEPAGSIAGVTYYFSVYNAGSEAKRLNQLLENQCEPWLELVRDGITRVLFSFMYSVIFVEISKECEERWLGEGGLDSLSETKKRREYVDRLGLMATKCVFVKAGYCKC